MKKINSFLAIMLMCSVLASCNQNVPNQEEMKQKALELASFLTDNYSQGDSIFFKTETGNTEGFIVEQNRFDELYISSEPDRGEEFKLLPGSYIMGTILRSHKNRIFVSINCSMTSNEVYGVLYINDELDLDDSNLINKDETLTISIADKSCVMQKNIGITAITGGKRTWTLIK